MKRLLKLLTHRLFFAVIMLLIQFIVLILLVSSFESYGMYYYLVFELIGISVLLKIINSDINPSYQMAWIIPVLTIPVFGTLFYLLFGRKTNKCTDRRMNEVNNKLKKYLIQDENVLKEIQNDNMDAYLQTNYLSSYCNFPVYDNTITKYFELGEDYFEKLIEELKKAKKYIFLEYFIINEGKMWNGVLDILSKKVNEGVDVRVIYDDMGSIINLPNNYDKYLNNLGIKTCSFNKFIPVLNAKLNNRDHRKIAIIDGVVGFTGGVNLADEYINEINRFGHWKDNGIMLKGTAVWNLTMIFLTTWEYISKSKVDYNKYKPDLENNKSSGYVQPYNDSPMDHENVGKTVYLNLINKAKKYIYITTPYLIIDDEIRNSLKMACKNGVDVRIITPFIADKKIVNEVTKAYYPNLLENGIKIYEYTPGFMHAKTFLVDDIYATVGTVNLDYRSLFLHFECGVLLYKTESIKDIKKDFDNLFKISKPILLSDTKISFFKKLKRAILILFAPLL